MNGRVIFDVDVSMTEKKRSLLLKTFQAAYRKNVGDSYNAFWNAEGKLHSYTCFPVDDTNYLSELLYNVTTAVIGQDRHNITVTVEVTEDDA